MQQYPFRIEDFITQRINEMNEFYQQLNLETPLQQNLEILQSFMQPSNQNSIQYSVQTPPKDIQFRQNSPPQHLPQHIPQHQQNNKQSKKTTTQELNGENQFQATHITEVGRVNFDDVPVKGRGRKFEDILEEQLGSQGPENGTKEDQQKHLSYLKKQSRKFLSHAQSKIQEENSNNNTISIVSHNNNPNQNNHNNNNNNVTKDKSVDNNNNHNNHHNNNVTQNKSQDNSNSQRLDSLDNLSSRSIRNSPKTSPKIMSVKLKKNIKNISPAMNSPNGEANKVKELRIQLEIEYQREKNLVQQLKMKQRKLEAQEKNLKIERERLESDQQKFSLERVHLVEEEKKKFRKELKQQEKNMKVQFDMQLMKEKEEISEVKLQMKTNIDSSHTSGLQMNKLKQQNEQFIWQRDQQEIEMQQLRDQLILYQLQIKDLQEENLQLLEFQSTKKPLKEPISSPIKKPIAINQEIQASKSAKLLKSQADISPAKLNISDLQSITVQDLGSRIDEQQFNFDQNPRYKQYLKEREIKSVVLNKTVDPDGKVNTVYKNGKKEVTFSSGIQKEIFKDGYTVVNFKNKDLKQVFSNGIVVYYFEDANATQTTLMNGQNIYKFYNKQIEIHHPNGQKEIKYQNGIVKVIEEDGQEQMNQKGRKTPFK